MAENTRGEVFLRIMRAVVHDGRVVFTDDPEKHGPRVFIPADEETRIRLNKRSLGEVLRGIFKLYRNYKFLKKAFALVNFAFERQDTYPNTKRGLDEFRNGLTIRAGHYDMYKMFDETRYKVARSWSFHNMSEEEFGDLYQAMIDVLVDNAELFGGADPGEFQAEILRFEGSGEI